MESTCIRVTFPKLKLQVLSPHLHSFLDFFFTSQTDRSLEIYDRRMVETSEIFGLRCAINAICFRSGKDMERSNIIYFSSTIVKSYS